MNEKHTRRSWMERVAAWWAGATVVAGSDFAPDFAALSPCPCCNDVTDSVCEPAALPQELDVWYDVPIPLYEPRTMFRSKTIKGEVPPWFSRRLFDLANKVGFHPSLPCPIPDFLWRLTAWDGNRTEDGWDIRFVFTETQPFVNCVPLDENGKVLQDCCWSSYRLYEEGDFSRLGRLDVWPKETQSKEVDRVSDESAGG